MKRRLLLPAACMLLLSACASSGARDGLVYRDGSWYAPPVGGRGDYYAGAAHGTAYDHPWDFSAGIVPWGGYCPVRYRYCTSFWADPFWGPGVYAHYDPYWYGPYWYDPWAWYYYRPAPRPHHLRPPRVVHEIRPRARDPEDRPRPRPWDERPVSVPRREGAGSGRPRWRAALPAGIGGGAN